MPSSDACRRREKPRKLCKQRVFSNVAGCCRAKNFFSENRGTRAKYHRNSNNNSEVRVPLPPWDKRGTRWDKINRRMENWGKKRMLFVGHHRFGRGQGTEPGDLGLHVAEFLPDQALAGEERIVRHLKDRK